MNPEIALQLWSVRNALQNDYPATLSKVAEIGYRNLELISSATKDGLVFSKDLPAVDLRKHLDRLGLRAVSCHFVPNAEMNLEAILEDLDELGVDSLACAIAFFTDQKSVNDFNRTFNHYAETCKKHGVQLYYHNHYHEFQVFDGRSVYEMMMEQMDKDLVKFEFDTFWALRGGQDPIYWLKKLGTRCDLIHQKDLPETAIPVNLFELFGYDSKIAPGTQMETQDAKHFTEIGQGKMNITGILQTCQKYNHLRYIIVEQDMTNLTEFESITVSLKNVKSLLASM